MSSEDNSPEDLKAARKKASQIGLFLGALSLVLGALACLYYLLAYQPHKFQQPQKEILHVQP